MALDPKTTMDPPPDLGSFKSAASLILTVDVVYGIDTLKNLFKKHFRKSADVPDFSALKSIYCLYLHYSP